MYTTKELSTCLFFDIETIPLAASLEDLPKPLKKIWLAKQHFKSLAKEMDFYVKDEMLNENDIKGTDICEVPSPVSPLTKKFEYDEIFIKYAALHAEFSRVICISVGGFVNEKLEDKKVVCLYDEDEKVLLRQFQVYVDKHPELTLAGFNIKAFDIPFLVKRFYINDLKVPKALQLRSKKPWNVNFVDTLEDWKGMMWESTSLDLLCNALGVKSPKDKFQNYEFTTLYYNNKLSIEDLKEYPNKDVRAHMECCAKLVTKQ